MTDPATDEVIIDGSQGEGGGQILRSSLALSAISGRPVSVTNIRAGRKKPGLMKQHLTGVNATAAICNARVEGAGIGSRFVRFVPGPIQPGRYHFQVGTAGSATLVLQTVLPALLTASAPSELTLEGGTHAPWAPPFDFLERCYLPLVNRMGPRVTVRLERHGFYPAGGGKFHVAIQPSEHLAGFDLLQRGKEIRRSARAVVAQLPEHIAERECKIIERKADLRPEKTSIEKVGSSGPGNFVTIVMQCEHVTEVFTGFGRKGIRAEQVADEVVEEFRDYLASQVPVGPHLADQWLLPLGLSAAQPETVRCRRGGSFRTMTLTDHSKTHLEVLGRFLDLAIKVEEQPGKTTLVTVGPGTTHSKS